MKCISWNVNGLRAVMKKGFMDVFHQLDADIFALQETKLQELTGGRYPVVSVSAKEQTGLSKLTEQIHNLFYQGEISVQDELYITNARQKHALWDAAEGLQRVQESISLGMPEDFYSIDLLAAYEALGTITGETVGEDLVNEIFSRFCMGK